MREKDALMQGNNRDKQSKVLRYLLPDQTGKIRQKGQNDKYEQFTYNKLVQLFPTSATR